MKQVCYIGTISEEIIQAYQITPSIHLFKNIKNIKIRHDLPFFIIYQNGQVFQVSHLDQVPEFDPHTHLLIITTLDLLLLPEETPT